MGPRDLDARLELAGTEAVRSEAFPYRIINTGTARLICGLGYLLEREDEGQWVAMSAGMAFPAIGLIVAPGHERQLTASIPSDAPPGHYRISTSVRSPPPPTPARSLDVSALLQIR